MKYKIHTSYKRLLADTFTPVSIYLKLRDKFPNSILLESSDYHGNENSYSFICFKPMAGIKIENEIITTSFPDGNIVNKAIEKATSVPNEIKTFVDSFDFDHKLPFGQARAGVGLFGYIAYDAVRYFEDVKIEAIKKESKNIPDINYNIYQYVIAINHFKDEIHIYDHSFDAPSNKGIEHIES